jgi:hypothetical protein
MTTWRAGAGRSSSAFGKLSRRERPQHVKFVAVRVGRDHPVDLALADADPAGAERFEPGDLCGLIARPQIQVQPILDHLALGNPQEQQIRGDTILRASRRRLQDNLIIRLVRTPPAERRLPERRDSRRITGVNAQALDAYIHPATVVGRSRFVERFWPLTCQRESPSSSDPHDALPALWTAGSEVHPSAARLLRVEGLRECGASAGQVIGGNHDLHAPKSRVSELDVDVSLSKLPGQLAEGARPILDIHYQHLALIGDPHAGALERFPAPGNGLVVKEQVDNTPAFTGERRKAANTGTDFASDLSQPGKLSRPVFKNHSQVRGHRIFDLAT